jgi:hypothetical protein
MIELIFAGIGTASSALKTLGALAKSRPWRNISLPEGYRAFVPQKIVRIGYDPKIIHLQKIVRIGYDYSYSPPVD